MKNAMYMMIIAGSLLFIASAHAQYSTDDKEDAKKTPQGMETKRFGGLVMNVPKGMEFKRDGPRLLKEDTTAWVARNFDDLNTRISKLEEDNRMLKRNIVELKASMAELSKKGVSK